MNTPRYPVPPGSTPLRELAHAIAGALTLPDKVTSLSEQAYLRISRDHARMVLFTMRRIVADHELDDDDLMVITASLRDQTGQLAAGNEIADPFREFIEAIIATLSLSPASSDLVYLQEGRQRARRVLLACRHAVENSHTDDRDLKAATELLTKTGDPDGDEEEAGQAPEMVP